MENRDVDEDQIVKPLKSIIRKATPEDLKIVEENKEKKKRAFKICEERIQAHGLEMSSLMLNIPLTQAKYCFFYTAPTSGL